jgi:hypothetical protein
MQMWNSNFPYELDVGALMGDDSSSACSRWFCDFCARFYDWVIYEICWWGEVVWWIWGFLQAIYERIVNLYVFIDDAWSNAIFNVDQFSNLEMTKASFSSESLYSNFIELMCCGVYLHLLFLVFSD